MKIKHAEYSITIQAPWHRGLCLHGEDQPWRCKNEGSFAIKVTDDRDIVVLQYANICDAHLLMVVIEELTDR